ncbi:hypothetical protein GCM10009549_26260 [Streptomyces thermoalcalitolerans]|uniref:Uncharacterized protein n=1 Tax=Streptomyces thermoalcalitolerans TaxID=65605 RepID=A0ABN1NNL2_9ACTN
MSRRRTGAGRWGAGQMLGAGVRHLDPRAVQQKKQHQPDVAAGKAAVTDCVGRQLGRDGGDGPGGFGVVREAGPLGGLLDGEAPGRPGAVSGAAGSQGQLAGSGVRGGFGFASSVN